ncbi:uncharacterized protein LOC122014241 isoform X1 [Zingiber officinale]|uniref:uncharacterized protein LOC122014241 isoform X1 n=1 Tax=Zingiber officinale TaxID=94328 RepID=UPI001C4D6821|nr:uncharacterized protein LOC122014241 isoform X1 [Zingiber officinale]
MSIKQKVFLRSEGELAVFLLPFLLLSSFIYCYARSRRGGGGIGMEKNTPVRKSHTSTSDLLTWSETPALAADQSVSATRRTLKPVGGISPVMFGAQLSLEEAESVNMRRPCSSSKMREMTGSRIFAADNENEVIESSNAVPNPNNKTSVRICQQAVNAISQISFNTEEKVSPKKPTSISEVAKQRELSGTVESELDAKVKKQLSEAKSKELSGNDIFGPPPEVPARPLAARNLELRGNLDFTLPQPRNMHTSVKVSNPAGGPSHITFSEESDTKTTKKIHTQKFQELTGNDIFKEDAAAGSTEKTLSEAKLKEMSGSDIFADGKAASRDYFGGVRKPPGGESSIALV